MRLMFFICCFLAVSVKCERLAPPNIVFIVADDLALTHGPILKSWLSIGYFLSTKQGWDDVSFHGSHQIMTPNIDTLAYQGTIMSQYYTDAYGTPSRSALFTGKYPLRMGTQGVSISASEDRGVPLSERLLPSYLQQLGYATHLIGKWGLGKSREDYLPTNRGFDTFYGFLGSSVDYYTYNHVQDYYNGSVLFGLDFFENLEPIEDQRGHLTNVLTKRAIKVIRSHNTSVPLYLHISHAAAHTGGAYVNLQTPESTIAENNHIAHPTRRIYAGLVTGLDDSVGSVVAALAERDMLHNTIIVFISDNGAPTAGFNRNFGSNLPLRGTKGTPWEGAVRATGIIWQASMPSKVWPSLFHVTDWLPTLIAAAGGDISEKIDGINQWSALSYGLTRHNTSPRNDLLVSLDDIEGWVAFREGNFKIIIGHVDREKSDFYSKELKLFRLPVLPYVNVLLRSETARVFKRKLHLTIDMEMALKRQNNLRLVSNTTSGNELCVPTKSKGCLFNLNNDPMEYEDLWYSNPEVVRRLVLRIRQYWIDLCPRQQAKMDMRANPIFHSFVWLPWLQDEEETTKVVGKIPPFPLQVSVAEIRYLAQVNLNAYKNSFAEYMKRTADSFIESVAELFSF